MYASMESAISGSGGKVDPIPVFDENGTHAQMIFDDVSLNNFEYDYLSNPSGSGHGFRERPWSWDGVDEGETYFNKPAYGPSGKGEVLTISHRPSTFFSTLGFSELSLKDSLGDRVIGVTVRDGGKYKDEKVLDGVQLDIDFNGSHRPDLDKNGSVDFVSAKAILHSTYSLTGFVLDENATFNDSLGTDVIANTTDDDRLRSLYVEEPSVYLIPSLGSAPLIDTETNGSFFRLNGLVEYDPSPGKGFFDLYVDHRFPANFYYGFSSNTLPSMGGSVTVTEGMPGMNWAVNGNAPALRKTYAYTDQNGFYAVGDLSPGLYNVAVFMEDKNFQEITFRPDSNLTQVSRTLYVPGFPDLVMQSDDFGFGVSRMIWNQDAREASNPVDDEVDELEYEQKILEGIGYGFDTNYIPELTIVPDASLSLIHI